MVLQFPIEPEIDFSDAIGSVNYDVMEAEDHLVDLIFNDEESPNKMVNAFVLYMYEKYGVDESQLNLMLADAIARC